MIRVSLTAPSGELLVNHRKGVGPGGLSCGGLSSSISRRGGGAAWGGASAEIPPGDPFVRDSARRAWCPATAVRPGAWPKARQQPNMKPAAAAMGDYE